MYSSKMDLVGSLRTMLSAFDFPIIYSVVVCAFMLWWFFRRSVRNYWSTLNIKYVEPVPFLGHTAPILFHLESFHEGYDKFYKALYDQPFGGIYEIRQPQLIVKDPELVSTILTKDSKYFYDRGMELQFSKDKKTDPLATNLFFTEGERWKALRQQVSPVFTSGKLKQMHDHISACIGLLIKYIDARLDANDSVDVGLKELFEKLTIDVIGSCFFGIDCNSLKSREEFSQMARKTTKPRLIFAVRLFLATISKRLASWLKITLMERKVNDFFVNSTLDTIDYRRQNGVTRNDLLQLLMELQNSHVDPKFAVGNKKHKIPAIEEFDEMDIVANSFLFFIAGFDTTASTLSFCFYELALNQDIQDKLRAEVLQFKIKSNSQTMTHEILREMTYMDAIISETLRKYPPLGTVIRKCTQDYTIPGTKTQIPSGTQVIIPVWSIQHDWKNYPKPEVFDPERFLGENKYSRPSGTYLPFGDGPRFCIGKRFAEMEIKAAMAEIILRYDIKPCAKTEIPLKYKKGFGMLHTTCGTWVNLVKRKFQ